MADPVAMCQLVKEINKMSISLICLFCCCSLY